MLKSSGSSCLIWGPILRDYREDVSSRVMRTLLTPFLARHLVLFVTCVAPRVGSEKARPLRSWNRSRKRSVSPLEEINTPKRCWTLILQLCSKKKSKAEWGEQTLRQAYFQGYPEVQHAFKDSMIHGILQFALRIAFRCVLHRCENQDIHCWKL